LVLRFLVKFSGFTYSVENYYGSDDCGITKDGPKFSPISSKIGKYCRSLPSLYTNLVTVGVEGSYAGAEAAGAAAEGPLELMVIKCPLTSLFGVRVRFNASLHKITTTP
jgi:hypothetical protein